VVVDKVVLLQKAEIKNKGYQQDCQHWGCLEDVLWQFFPPVNC
jgi:hypothetical protein